jgi:hypothetical protein
VKRPYVHQLLSRYSLRFPYYGRGAIQKLALLLRDLFGRRLIDSPLLSHQMLAKTLYSKPLSEFAEPALWPHAKH